MPARVTKVQPFGTTPRVEPRHSRRGHRAVLISHTDRLGDEQRRWPRGEEPIQDQARRPDRGDILADGRVADRDHVLRGAF